jgi:apolipoprotein D and lipocalin family protein
MARLEDWSHGRRPTAEEEEAEAAARKKPLCEMAKNIDIEAFMGRWYVAAGIPTYFEKGMMNSIEDYRWDPVNQRVEVFFRMQSAPGAKPTVLRQRATIANTDTNTRWSISPKVGLYLPLNLAYLVIDCAEDYSTCVIGVPDRSYLWIMARSPEVDEGTLQHLVNKSVRCGYDASKIVRVAHDYGTAGVPDFAFNDKAVGLMDQKLREALEDAAFESAVARVDAGLYSFGPVTAMVEFSPEGEVVAVREDGTAEPIYEFIRKVSEEIRRAADAPATMSSPLGSIPEATPKMGNEQDFPASVLGA